MTIDSNRHVTTNAADDLVKVLSFFEGCPGLRVELHGFTECCVTCTHNFHRFCVDAFGDVEIEYTDESTRSKGARCKC